MSVLKFNINKFLIGIWTLALLCFRPSIFGEKYNALVLVIFVFLTFLVLFREERLAIEKKTFEILFLITALCLYLFVQGVLSGSRLTTVSNSCILIVVVSFCVAGVVKNNKDRVIRSFIYLHFIMALSSIITFSIFALFGLSDKGLVIVLNLNNLLDRQLLEYQEMYANHYLYFPFSHSWASVGFGGKSIPRLLGIYREAGMAQIFFMTAYFFTYLVEFAHRKFIRAVILIGGLLTFSTSGLLSFIGGFLMLRYIPAMRIRLTLNRIVIVLVVLPALISAALFLPDIGILAKVSSFSGNQRTESYVHSLERFAENPILGHGYYKDFELMETDQNYVQFLGLIGVLYQIGLIGLILYALPWIYSLVYSNDKRTYFVLAPCLFTLLFSQPSYNDMVVWFLLLINFKSLIDPTATHLDTVHNPSHAS